MTDNSEKVIIYHNGECSKSNGALEILQEQNIPHEVRWYMTDTLSKDEIKSLLNKLNIPPSKLVRKNETLYKETYADRGICEGEWLTILAENPVLIERPVVTLGNRAVLARPTEKIFDLIGVHTY